MANFTINSEININFINITTFKRPSQNKPVPVTINNFNNTKTANVSRLYQNRAIDRNRNIPRFNDRKNVRKQLDTSAIRENRYDFSTGRFDEGYPRLSNYPLCPQKISAVFKNGGTHFTTSAINSYSSYPLNRNFLKITDIPKLSSADCGCYYVDFTGEYTLDWSLAGGGRLLSSNNPDVNLGTFTFHESDEYFDIFLYPKSSLYSSSYVHIRYRIPIRYRYSYGDWTFWESVLLENTMSETEFVKIVDCCDTNTESLTPIAL
jgi:hypothetical protein